MIIIETQYRQSTEEKKRRFKDADFRLANVVVFLIACIDRSNAKGVYRAITYYVTLIILSNRIMCFY